MENLNWKLLQLVLIMTNWTVTVLAREPREYCQGDLFEADCGDGEVILMETVRYGRMRIGRCTTNEYDLDCEEDVLPFFDQRCSGRKTCSVYIAEQMLYKMNPCPKELASYLEAAYTCVKVATAGLTSCNDPRSTQMLLTDGEGYIASHMTIQRHPVGTQDCPWTIRVPEGQKVKLTILSFGRGRMTGLTDDNFQSALPDVPSSVGAAESNMECERLGTITENSIQNALTPCGTGNGREFHVFTSRTNQIGLYLNPGIDLNKRWRFLVKYKAVGCPRLHPPQGAYLESFSDDTAVVKCNKSGETWYLTCGDDGWVGDLRNCSKDITSGGLNMIDVEAQLQSLKSSWITRLTRDGSSSTESEYRDTEIQNFPFGILLIVALGVALGVFLGGILLTVAAVHMKKKRNKKYENPQTSADLYSAYQTRCSEAKSKLHVNSPQSYYDMDGFSTHDYGLHHGDCPTHGHGSMASGPGGQQGDVLMNSSDLVDSHQEQRHHQHSVLHSSQYGTNSRPLSQHSHLYEKNQSRPGT